MPASVKNAGYLLQSLASAANVRAVGDGVEVPGNPWFRYHQCDGWELAKGLHEYGENHPIYPPVPDWSTWNGSARVYEVLNAMDEYPAWAPTSGTSEVMGYATRPANEWSGSNEYFTCIVADWMLPYVSGQILGGEPAWLRYLPPIWPGTEYVHQKAPYTINGPLEVGVTCNGIIVDMGTVPDYVSTYDWGAIRQTPRAAYVSFINDGGYAEDVQPITFPKHSLCPKLCRLASGFYIRPKAGVELVVTPWEYYVP